MGIYIQTHRLMGGIYEVGSGAMIYIDSYRSVKVVKSW
jgi:hypothetical protein